jgi:hypothetical protein
MKNLVSRFVKDESGATAIEYGLIAAASRSRSSPPSMASAASCRRTSHDLNSLK